jgi:hypothetical protein
MLRWPTSTRECVRTLCINVPSTETPAVRFAYERIFNPATGSWADPDVPQ